MLTLIGILGLSGVLYATGGVFASVYAEIYRSMDDSALVPDVPHPR